MIASNTQRQEHNNLATIWRENLREPMRAPRASSLSYNPKANYNNNGQGNRYRLIPYNKQQMTNLNYMKTDTSIIKKNL